MVRREREPGASRDHYRIDDDMWYEVYMQRSAVLERLGEDPRRGVALTGSDDAARNRIVEAKEFVSFLRAELPELMERWHEHRAQLLAKPRSRRAGG